MKSLNFFPIVLCFALFTQTGLAQKPRVEKAIPVAPRSNVDPGATFRPGDAFELRMTGMPMDDAQMYSLQFTIGTDGFVNIPLGGQVRAAGLTQSQLERAIEQRLIEQKIFRFPTATINVPAPSRFVTVGGNVRGPNRIQWSSDLSILSAISAVGGPGEFAGDRVELIRAGKMSSFRMSKLRKDPLQDPKLVPGDQIELR